MAGQKLLFVDNSRTMRATLEKFLTKKGYEVIAVATGMEALEEVRKGEYALVIIDLYMHGMDGFEIAERIRSLAAAKIKDIPIVIYTSSQNEPDRNRCKEIGATDYVLKQDGLPSLAKAVSKIIG